MISKALGFVVAFGCLVTSASLQAHHSTAGVYDPGKEVKVTGALAKLQFVNPHGSIVVTVKNADGTPIMSVAATATPVHIILV